VEAVLTEALIKHVICNSKEINPEYWNVLSKTYPSKWKIRDTKDHARLS
jgi:hypothetical protein